MRELRWGPFVVSGGAIPASPKPQTVKNSMHDEGGGLIAEKSKQSPNFRQQSNNRGDRLLQLMH